MRKRFCSAAIASLVSCLGLAGFAEAAPSLRVQVDQKGDFVLIGNTIGYECNNAVMPVVGTTACGASMNNGDSAPDLFWRADDPMNGQASANIGNGVAQARSTAVLNLPAGAVVTHAYLYWGATLAAAGADASVLLDRPGGFSQNINALKSYQGGNSSYHSVADITQLVQANGSGAYRVAGIDMLDIVNLNNANPFGGWWMVVLYQDPNAPLRNLAVYEGMDAVAMGQPQNVVLSGFVVPNAGFDAKLGVITFEGDDVTAGDQLFFNGGAALSDGQNPANNFFNATRSYLGNAVTVAGDLPQMPGTARSMSGIDIDVVDVQSKLMPGQTSVPIQATSSADVYFLAGWVTSISTYRPDFTTSVKTALDLNGGSLVPGDEIEYTIVVTNTGNDSSINTVLKDVLPAGLSYVPGSLQISQGPNSGLKTDGLGDDQGEYTAGNKTLTVRLGVGANAVQGGTLSILESTTVVFKALVNSGVSGTINNQAVITAAGLLGAPSANTPTDGNGAANGAPPTEVLVEQCGNDSHCLMPTPYCNVAANPNVCVQCLNDTHCPGTLPTCNPATNVCICLPSGPEICDGIDNNCDGTADEGFGVGVACSAGMGECFAAGIVVCNGPNSSSCNAVPSEPQSEDCDAKDNDCDGVIDNGFNVGQMCSAGVGACQAQGIFVCNGTMATMCSAIPTEPNTEVCDGIDNDCNGMTDEGFNVGDPCSVGMGICASNGNIVCDGTAVSKCNAIPGEPTNEVCGNGLDDDCDGTPDNGCNPDADGDGLSDDEENTIGTNPNDADSDDDGVPDGAEPEVSVDTDGDGLINGLDPDSDNDGLFDGTELGLDCTNPATDAGAGHCSADGDGGATKTDPLDADTDDGGVNDGSEDSNLNGVVDGSETDPTAGQGADDASNADADGDGLSDDLENTLGTDPMDADSDDDGIPDGMEANPSDDSDGDGFINALDADSDNDGLFDGTEMGADCSNPATDISAGTCVPDGDGGATTTSPVNPDTDGGGVNDGSEDSNLNGVNDAGESDPTQGHGSDDMTNPNADSDGDGLSDTVEITLGTDPNDADSDDDGVSDGQEPNPSEDSDGDGLINPLDPDSDNDGLFDGTEMGLDCNGVGTDTGAGHCVADADGGATTTNPLDWDSDNGGVSDGSEDANGNGQFDIGETNPVEGEGADDSTNADSDNDGLSDSFENQIGSDPNDADSDDDGVIDGQEANPADDTDGDGLINAMDSDSDDDGLFDGTEMGLDCSNPATDAGAGQCIADGDGGSTTTSPVNPDTDGGGVKDGDEDANHNGVIDAGETDPTKGHGADDMPVMQQCTVDSECGDSKSGKICDSATNTCVDGCRGEGGNGCPDGQSCTSTDMSAGVCEEEKESFWAEGNGFLCAARSSGQSDQNDAPWMLGALFALGLGLRRSRRIQSN